VVRLRKGIGWVDTASGEYALPPDGETFALAPGAVEGAHLFHVVEAPRPVAIVRAPHDDRERGRIEGLLADHVEHTAFVGEERDGFAVVDGRGPPVVLATAVAALKAIGGWDESVPISIAVNAERFDVRLSYDGERWMVDVTTPDR